MKNYSSLLEEFKVGFAQEFYTRVVDRTPIGETGNLQANWSIDLSPDTIEITNDTPYAVYVEYGTYKMAPRGMMRTTALESEDIAKIVKERVGL